MDRSLVGMVLMMTCPRCARRGMRVASDKTHDLMCVTCGHTVPGAGVPREAPFVQRRSIERTA